MEIHNLQSEIITTQYKQNFLCTAPAWFLWALVGRLALTVAVQHPLLSEIKNKMPAIVNYCSYLEIHQVTYNIFSPAYLLQIYHYYRIQIGKFFKRQSTLKSVAFAHKQTETTARTGVVVLAVLVIQFSEKLVEVVLMRNPFILQMKKTLANLHNKVKKVLKQHWIIH